VGEAKQQEAPWIRVIDKGKRRCVLCAGTEVFRIGIRIDTTAALLRTRLNKEVNIWTTTLSENKFSFHIGCIIVDIIFPRPDSKKVLLNKSDEDVPRMTCLFLYSELRTSISGMVPLRYVIITMVRAILVVETSGKIPATSMHKKDPTINISFWNEWV
jgi:hypothetical protein